jgi:hypothetical protein
MTRSQPELRSVVLDGERRGMARAQVLFLGFSALLCLVVTSDTQAGRFAGRGGFAHGGGYAAMGPRGGAAGSFHTGGVVGPYGGAGFGSHASRTVVGPAGGSYHAGATHGSYTTAGGSSISYGAAGRGFAGPYGGAAGRAVGGVHVTTPGGQSYTHVGGARGAVGPGGVAVGSRSGVAATSGPRGSAVGVSHAAAAAGPYGAVGTRYLGGVGVGHYGAVAGSSRMGVATGYRGTAVAGSRYGVAATRFGTYHVSGAALRTQGFAVRRGFGYYNAFSPAWYRRYPGAWYGAGWAAGRAWVAPAWSTVAFYGGLAAQPIYYDYGSNIVYNADNVYVNGEPVAAAEYDQQATQLADAGREAKPPEMEEWQPLGVFALVRGEEQTSDKIFQLALSVTGVIRGNYFDALADNTLPVYGSLDKATQRAAWSIGEKKDVVFEAGIANLTKDETPVLVHFGNGNDQQLTLVRVEKPQG